MGAFNRAERRYIIIFKLIASGVADKPRVFVWLNILRSLRDTLARMLGFFLSCDDWLSRAKEAPCVWRGLIGKDEVRFNYRHF